MARHECTMAWVAFKLLLRQTRAFTRPLELSPGTALGFDAYETRSKQEWQ